MNILEECVQAELVKGHLYIGVDPEARSDVFHGQAQLEDAYGATSRSHRSKFEDGQVLATRNLSQILAAIRDGFADDQGVPHYPITKLTLAQVSFPRNMRGFSTFLDELFEIPHFVALELQSFGYGKIVPLLTTEQLTVLTEKMGSAKFLERFVLNTCTTSDGFAMDDEVRAEINRKIQNLIRKNNTLKYFEAINSDELDDYILTQALLAADNTLSEAVLGNTKCPSKSLLLKMKIPKDRQLAMTFDVTACLTGWQTRLDILPGEGAARVSRKKYTGYIEGTNELMCVTSVFTANKHAGAGAGAAAASTVAGDPTSERKRKVDFGEEGLTDQMLIANRKSSRFFVSTGPKQTIEADLVADAVGKSTDVRDHGESGASSAPSLSLASSSDDE